VACTVNPATSRQFQVGDFVVFNDEAQDAANPGRWSYGCAQITAIHANQSTFQRACPGVPRGLATFGALRCAHQTGIRFYKLDQKTFTFSVRKVSSARRACPHASRRNCEAPASWQRWPAERASVLAVLHEERFQDRAPATIQATLLDEGQYLCSTRTMYRILEQEGESRERRDQLVHPPYQKPELLATAPNQLWSWDNTKPRGPVKWTYFYLYVILDLFSRYVVGWMLAPGESAELAKKLIQESLAKQGVSPGQLHIHADNGPSMTTKTLALKLADLGVTKSHSRPCVSDNNPFSGSQFKTLKYRPEFPDRFGSLEAGRAHCQGFFHWYNHETTTAASRC